MKDTKNNVSKKKKRKKKKSLFARFVSIVFSILLVYFIVMAGIFAYTYLTYNPEEPKENPTFTDKIVEKIKPTLPEYTTILLAGTDEGERRTDTIMLISYNSVVNKASIVSIPRDTRVSIPENMWEVMVKNEPIIANDNPNYKKINAIPNYGKEQGIEFLQEYLENLLDIKIDYYVHFNLEGFRFIVDSVGGIEFDVPVKMRHDDPYIHLDPGVQLLDGEKAEQLVRYRGYGAADLGRVKTQQEFLKAFLDKVLSLNTIISNPSAYFTTLNEYVETNVGMSDILKYLPEAKTFSTNNIETYTLPNTPVDIGGISYVEVDEQEAIDFAYEIFKKPITKPEDIVYEDSFDKSIIVLNGSYTSGMAAKTKKVLENNGYIVGKIGDSSDTKSEETKIYVSKEGVGNDLQKFFTNSKIVVNQNKTEELGYDIIIVIGTKEELVENIEQTEDNSSSESE